MVLGAILSTMSSLALLSGLFFCLSVLYSAKLVVHNSVTCVSSAALLIHIQTSYIIIMKLYLCLYWYKGDDFSLYSLCTTVKLSSIKQPLHPLLLLLFMLLLLCSDSLCRHVCMASCKRSIAQSITQSMCFRATNLHIRCEPYSLHPRMPSDDGK